MRIPYDGCPLCGGDANYIGVAPCTHHPRWREPLPPSMAWQSCRSCGHLFTDGYFTDEALEILFGGTNAEQVPGWNPEAMRHVWAPTFERLSSITSGSWLDVGFGDGSALGVAAEFGFDPVGIDLRPSTVDAAADLGFEVYCSDVESFDGGPFDVVSMFDVIEHVPYPKAALLATGRLLAPDGLLVVSTPNMDSHAWRHLDRTGQNPYWSEIEHFHIFTRRRLVALLDECGFDFVSFAIADRFRLGMEIVARKRAEVTSCPAI